MKYIFFTIITILLLSGCSRKLAPIEHHNSYGLSKTTNKSKIQRAQSKKEQNSLAISQKTDLKKLYRQYRIWKGTPYKYGGLSLNGVDCSGFVYNAYKNIYNISLPRTTKNQVRKGKRVYLYELRTGDLLFFETGWDERHVGIYLEKGKFMHASSSKGVKISSIRNPYWKDHYWQARRLF